jgi:hypothetical protein
MSACLPKMQFSLAVVCIWRQVNALPAEGTHCVQGPVIACDRPEAQGCEDGLVGGVDAVAAGRWQKGGCQEANNPSMKTTAGSAQCQPVAPGVHGKPHVIIAGDTRKPCNATYHGTLDSQLGRNAQKVFHHSLTSSACCG